MRTSTLFCALVCCSIGRAAETPPEAAYFPTGCSNVQTAAYHYLARHGLNVDTIADGLKIAGIFGRQIWTDAKGNKITDLTVYWTYADRKSDKLLIGVWHLRLAHYVPLGQVKLLAEASGCRLEFALEFQTSGANVFGIAPMDSSWYLEGNGRL